MPPVYKIILLVEDAPEVALNLKLQLTLKGYTVFWGQDGNEALKILDILNETHQPCLILCDLAMPVMDGWQFVEKAHASAKLVTIPIVIHSSGEKTPEGYPVLKKSVDLTPILLIVEKYCGLGEQH